MNNKSLKVSLIFAIIFYALVVSLIFNILKYISYNYSFEHLQDHIMLVKAERHFVSNEQKKEVYNLQQEGILSKEYFKPELLSSTYSDTTVNKEYNLIRKEHGLDPIKLRFASNNPRNPLNKANEFESTLLKQFNTQTLFEYKEIKYNEDGHKVMYFAMPSRPLEPKCMKCHSTPDKAPQGLVNLYGDTNGFNEELGSIRALISTEYPLTKTDNFIYKTTFLLSLLTLLIFAIFISFYIRYSNKILLANKKLEKMNETLEERVDQKTQELLKSNTKLNQQKNFLDTLIQTTPIPLFVKDIEGKYIDINTSFSEFTGYSKEEIIGKSVYDIAPKKIADIYYSQDKKVFNLEENPQSYESKVVNKNTQDEYEVIFYKSAFFDENKNVKGIIGSVIDLTKIKALEKENIDREKRLFEQTKKADMGEMLNNIAHQWRQPLSVISTAASGMQLQKEMDILSDEQFYLYCERINENAQYLSQTIDDFRNFIKGDTKPVQFNLKNDTDSFIKLVDSTIKNYHIQVILELEEHIDIKGYPNELIQCFINIFNNSKDAFLEQYIDEENRYIFITQRIIDNNVVITFKDSAGGVPENILPKVFDPYFTTKHQSVGTGIGLHMVYNIVVNHMKGTIKCQNEEYIFNDSAYKGAVFIITLPIT